MSAYDPLRTFGTRATSDAMNVNRPIVMRALVRFLAATIIALILSALSDRYLRLSESVSYLVFGATLAISYEVLRVTVFRER